MQSRRRDGTHGEKGGTDMKILTGKIVRADPLVIKLDGEGELTVKKPLGFQGVVGSRVYLLQDGNKYVVLQAY